MCKTLSDVPEINEEDETHEHPAAAGEKVGFSRGEATLWTTISAGRSVGYPRLG